MTALSVHPQRLLILTANPPSGRYSVHKFLALQQYIAQATPWRAAWIMVSTPLPGLVCALIPAFLPLQHPREGPGLFYLHIFFVILFVTFGTMVSWIAVTQLSPRLYSVRDAAAVAVCAALLQISFDYGLFSWWRFPVPFLWLVAAVPWILNIGLAHLVVFGAQWWRERVLFGAIKLYFPAWLVQMIQLALYPGISILFDRVAPKYQILLTLLFPFIKIAMKMIIKRLSRGLKEHRAEVAVSGVEICASVYQSMIMQSTPSRVAIALLMGLDMVQGLIAIKLLMDRPTVVPRSQVQRRAQSAIVANRIESADQVVVPAESTSTTSARRSTTGLSDQKRVMRHALQLAQTAETILLVEYFEVAVPLVNSVFLLVAASCQSAQYNPVLAPFYQNPSALVGAVTSIMVYTLMQVVSLVVMHLVMKRRYGMSAGYHLAFVLERHRQSIQGKLVSWLPIILHFTATHYGTDFSFQFNFHADHPTARLPT